jgi:hypothetical protein
VTDGLPVFAPALAGEFATIPTPDGGTLSVGDSPVATPPLATPISKSGATVAPAISAFLPAGVAVSPSLASSPAGSAIAPAIQPLGANVATLVAAQTAPASTAGSVTAAVAANRGSLAATGTDMVDILLVCLAALALGAVLVRAGASKARTTG